MGRRQLARGGSQPRMPTREPPGPPAPAPCGWGERGTPPDICLGPPLPSGDVCSCGQHCLPGWSFFVLVRCICRWLQPQRAAGRQITANPSSQEMLWTSLSVSLTHLLFLHHPIFLLPTAKGNRRFPPSLSLALLEAGKVKVLVAQPCPTLYNPMDCSPDRKSVV